MKQDPLDRKVRKFIRLFRCAGTIRIFTQGCCYWFAHILATRFHGSIMYNDIDNHFICKIGYYYYDITGPIHEPKGYVLWTTYQACEPLNSYRVTKDCINIV